MADTPRGGAETAFAGVTIGRPKKKLKSGQAPDAVQPPVGGLANGNAPQSPALTLAPTSAPTPDTPSPQNTNIDPSTDLAGTEPDQTAEPDQFAGLGPWLEDDDTVTFNRAQDLVLRQELLAQNRLAQDVYFTAVKLGYPFYTLEKDANRDTYRCTLPAGSKHLQIQAVPNQAWDLVNKATEAIMADPPQPDPTPLNDSEEARGAAELADRFLSEDAGEHGTNDTQMFYTAIDGALATASKFIEGFTDPQGGGYVPLQILAHPEAESPADPLKGPDGFPTPNPVLRYVTGTMGPDGQLSPDAQFTDQPADAAPQWQAKIRGRIWGREHWRIYPESEPVDTAQMAIGLLYCTLAEAKRRWPRVAAMAQDELNSLLDWTPPRYLVLLPPFQRARWKVSSGSDFVKAGSSDERLMFYYRVLVKADAEHTHGAEVIVTGAIQGTVLHRDVLAVTVDAQPKDAAPPSDQPQAQPQAPATAQKETRCMDLPLAQLTPRADPDERDPTGRAYMQMFAGATEADAALMTGFMEAMDLWLHPDSYMAAVSAVSADQVMESRSSGGPIPILKAEDRPVYGNQPPIPPNFFEAYDHVQSAIRSIASLDKAVTGEEDPTKESGKALQLAIGRALVGLQRMNYPVNSTWQRWWRIKLQLAMRDYTTPQMVRYVGEDGAYMVDEFRGVDFALVGDVGVESGTGTLMPPEQKVQYLANVKLAGFLQPDEAADVARATFGPRLGLPDDPHMQYIERCVTLWLKGMPDGFQALWSTYMQQRQQYNELKAQAARMQPPAAPSLPGMPSAPPPADPLAQLPPPTPPWTPFGDRPNDTEPAIAAKWARRLSAVMSTVKYTEAPIEWRQCLDEKYERARQVASMALGAPVGQPAPPGPRAPMQPPTATPMGAGPS